MSTSLVSLNITGFRSAQPTSHDDASQQRTDDEQMPRLNIAQFRHYMVMEFRQLYWIYSHPFIMPENYGGGSLDVVVAAYFSGTSRFAQAVKMECEMTSQDPLPTYTDIWSVIDKYGFADDEDEANWSGSRISQQRYLPSNVQMGFEMTFSFTNAEANSIEPGHLVTIRLRRVETGTEATDDLRILTVELREQ